MPFDRNGRPVQGKYIDKYGFPTDDGPQERATGSIDQNNPINNVDYQNKLASVKAQAAAGNPMGTGYAQGDAAAKQQYDAALAKWQNDQNIWPQGGHWSQGGWIQNAPHPGQFIPPSQTAGQNFQMRTYGGKPGFDENGNYIGFGPNRSPQQFQADLAAQRVNTNPADITQAPGYGQAQTSQAERQSMLGAPTGQPGGIRNWQSFWPNSQAANKTAPIPPSPTAAPNLQMATRIAPGNASQTLGGGPVGSLAQKGINWAALPPDLQQQILKMFLGM